MNSERIVCVTPNVALDRTLVVPDFAIGHISRIPRAIAVPGGKGLNVLRAVEILGGKALAMGLLGGFTGRMIASMVREAGYEAEWTAFEGETRTCTIIAPPDGNSTVINEAGGITAGDWRALVADISRVAQRGDARTICLCGSLPVGAPDGAPGDLVARIKRLGKCLWVDSSQRALKNAIAAKPYAIKINRDEFAEALDQRLTSRADIVAAAKNLVAGGISIVVISLGAAGAMLISERLVAEATPPAIQPVDPIASGDCLHAGIVTALAAGQDLGEALRWGVAAGTVNALYAGGAQFPRERFEAILAGTGVSVTTA